MPALEAKDLRKSYRGLFRSPVRALDGFDLTVEHGAAFGLIGPNGAGKTTFIKVILGIVRPTAGRVRLLGGDPEDPAIRARIGYLPERLELPPFLRPVDFLSSVHRLKRLPPEPRRIAALLERVGLLPHARRRIGTFSKGMRQRLGMAAALVGSPELIVMDEPTDGIDPLGRREVRRILTEERERGATLFLNSHLLSETELLCDRVGILAEGRIVLEGSLEELRSAGARWRLRFADGVTAEALLGAGLTPAPGGAWAFYGDELSLNDCLDRVRGAGAVVVELVRDSRSLEDVLGASLESAA